MQKLLEKELIEISGKSDGPGRPILYGTSHSFMDYFGIKSVKDLPQLKDLNVGQENEIGLPVEIDYVEAESVSTESIVEGEESLFPEREESVNSEAESKKEVTSENAPGTDVRDEENWELPDRKSIFIENEMKYDIDEEKPKIIDPEDFS